MSCPSIWATLSALTRHLLLGSFQLFLHSDQPLSLRIEIIPFSSVCQSGRLHYPRRRRREQLHALTDRLLWCATDDDQRQHHHAEHIIFRKKSYSPFRYYFYISARRHGMQRRWCAAFAFQFSGIFVALGFVGNGVITVMINSPWQANDDADNQSGDNRGDSAHTSISLTVPPASLNFAIRLSALCSRRP